VILSASVGSGHVRAAQAIHAALDQLLPNATIAHVDVLQLTNSWFRSLYGDGYFRTVERAPHAVRWMYDALDHADATSTSNLSASLRLTIERMNFSRLIRFLTSQHWDLAINTHFLPPELIGWLRRTGRVDFPQATVVTDFDVHGLWVQQPCEQYFVACESARARIAAAGIDPTTISATGIPISPEFALHDDPMECRRRHGLAMDRPVVLQLAGGFGIGSIEQTFRSICDVKVPTQIAVVTGKNSLAKEKLEKMVAAKPTHHAIRILGFTRDMHELMAAADVVVSKPGGLTTSEALSRGCPMMIVEPIPGQEDHNADFLLENGCAIKVNHPSVLTHRLTSLLSDPSRLQQMRQAASRVARPRAAFHIAGQVIELLRSRMPIDALTP
jgi:processive 1,2-diacylglycerol beta-glucosyltransferase